MMTEVKSVENGAHIYKETTNEKKAERNPFCLKKYDFRKHSKIISGVVVLKSMIYRG